MIQLRYIIVLLASLLLFVGCSRSDPSGTAYSGPVTASLSTVNAKITSVANLMGGTSTSASPLENWAHEEFDKDYVSRAAATGFGANWDTGGNASNLYNGPSYTIKQWFTDQFDENFQNSSTAFITFGGRLKSALDIICYLPALNFPTDATNLPTVGTHTGTITPAIALQCGGETTTESRPVTVVSAATSNTNLYDRFITVNFGNTCPFKIYAKIDASTINIATAEDQNCDGRDHGSRTIVHHNKSTDKTRFYYVSKAFGGGNSGFSVFKGYVDGTADNAYIVGFYGGDDGSDSTFESGVSFTAVGKPTAGGTVAVSATTDFPNNPGVKGTYQACINPSTMAVANDNTLACTLTGSDSLATHTNVIIDDYDNKGYDTRSDIYDIGETTTVDFTDNTDIFN